MTALLAVAGTGLALVVGMVCLFARAQREADELRDAQRRRRQLLVIEIEPNRAPDVRHYLRMRRHARLEQLRRRYGRPAGGSAA